jgi:cystathionine beta-lyase/cystathionine gamma-synthase
MRKRSTVSETAAYLGRSSPLVPPLFQSAVYTLPDLDALDAIMSAEAPGFIYARDAHPNARLLADQLAAAEGAAWAHVCGSGMGAITAALLAVVGQGDRVVASNRLYGKTSQLLRDELGRFGVQTTFVDTSDLEQIRAALAQPARVLFVETVSNPLLRLVDLPELVRLVRHEGTELIVDNTFATPALLRPLDHGADVVIESLTKMIGGHSDVTLGLVCGRGDLGAQTGAVISTWGLTANPYDCWLAARGLATLGLRMKTATANAVALADWLVEQPGVLRVIYPGRADHPDHGLAGRLLSDGCGNMLCFEVEDGRDGVNRFLTHAPGIPFSPSLGHTATTLSHPATTSHRFISPAEKRRQGITDGLIRLSVGIEAVGAIKDEIKRGLA